MSRAEVLDVLRDTGPLCLCAHASPDGDALGSLLGLGRSLAATGRDVVLYQDGDEPFPRELAFLELERIQRRLPADAAQRTLIALDCGSALRIDRRGEVAGQFARVINIDHHHDNTLFGAVNLVDAEASCTAEIVAGLLDEAGIPLAEGAALALYVGLVTDTGRFQYANTTPRAQRLAAGSGGGRAAGALFSTIFETLPLARQRLLGLALGRARWPAAGAWPDLARARRFRAHRRRRRGLRGRRRRPARDQGRGAGGADPRAARPHGPARKGSLRSRAGGVDFSAIARERGGGGHIGAAGYSTDESLEEIVDFLRAGGRRVNAAVLLVDKPAGPTSFECVARVRRALGAARSRSATPARSIRSRPACWRARGRSTRLAPYLVGLDKRYVATCSSACAPTPAIPRVCSCRAARRCPSPPRSQDACAELVGVTRRCRRRRPRSRSTASAPTSACGPARPWSCRRARCV